MSKSSGTFPDTLAELQSYDTIFLSNLSAGDLGLDSMRLLESAVRDFGVGLVCVGGDQSVMRRADIAARRWKRCCRWIWN